MAHDRRSRRAVADGRRAFLWGGVAAAAGVVGLGAVLAGLPEQAGAGRERHMSEPAVTPAVTEVLKQYSDWLVSLPGVVGASEGLCAGRPCIKVFVTKATPELVRRIPPTLEGVKISVEETGAFRPRDP